MSIILAIAGLAVAAIVSRAISKLPQAAFIEGRRRGLLQAADVCKMRSVAALELAPEGCLGLGLVRAQVADNIASELQTMAHEEEN